MQLRTLLFSTLAASAAACLAQTEIKFGHVGEPASLFTASAEEFAKRANARVAGKAKVVVFGSSQLGSDRELLQKLKLGTVDMAVPSTVMSSEADMFGVFEMPYIIVSHRHMKAVAESPDLKKALFEPQAVKALRLLAYWENGFRHVTNNARAITKPEDLRGIKLRIPRGVWRQKMFQAYGANPTPMAFAEVFTALQTGVMDGQENPLAQIWGAKFHEVQRFLSMTGHVYTPAYPVAGERWWQTVPPDLRITIRRIAIEVGDYARQQGERLDNSLVAEMQKANPRLRVNEVDKAAFIAASRAIYEDFSKEVSNGAALIRLIQALAR